MHTFQAKLDIIDVNPFIWVPQDVLEALFLKAGRDKGPIPIRGKVNGRPYIQTLVKFRGAWRLYINTTMLANSPKRIGEIIQMTVEYDPKDRSIQAHPKLLKALSGNKEAQGIFNDLSPSMRKEMLRYISSLKTEESIDRNVERAIGFLLGKNRFVGRDKP